MAQLSIKQQRLLQELRRRAANATADSIEASWLAGELAYLDARGRAGRGLETLFKKANKIKQTEYS